MHHLHSEAKILKVQEHLDMVCTQFLATSLHPLHPSFQIVMSESGPRAMKNTFNPDITQEWPSSPVRRRLRRAEPSRIRRQHAEKSMPGLWLSPSLPERTAVFLAPQHLMLMMQSRSCRARPEELWLNSGLEIAWP